MSVREKPGWVCDNSVYLSQRGSLLVPRAGGVSPDHTYVLLPIAFFKGLDQQRGRKGAEASPRGAIIDCLQSKSALNWACIPVMSSE